MNKDKKDLKIRAYFYALNVIKFIDKLNNKDFVIATLSKQLIRSATSVGANIVEAQAASTKKDFANFFSYSLKSANESKFWLGLLRDSGKAKKEIVDILLKETNDLSNILGASIITLRKNIKKNRTGE
ncbi:MAG: four helix bundle protein [Candidatus Moraniibacteriota bacterium]